MSTILVLSPTLQDAEFFQTTVAAIQAECRVLLCPTQEAFKKDFQAWQPDLILFNVDDPQFVLKDMIAWLSRQQITVPLICYASRGEIDIIVDCLRAGAVDFVLCSDEERLKVVLQRELAQPTKPIYRQIVNHQKRVADLSSRLESLLQAIPDPVYFKDLEGRYQIFNRAFAELVGRTAEEIKGKTDSELLPAELAAACQQSDAETYRTNQLYSSEEVFQDSEGKRHYFDTKKVPLIDPDGRVVGITGISREITAQKQVADNLIRTHHIYQKAIETARGIPYLRNFRTDSYDFIGSNCQELFGIPAAELTPARLRTLALKVEPKVDLSPPEGVSYEQLLRTGKIEYYRADVKIKTPAGKIRWFSDHAIPIAAEPGEQIWGCLGILQDITSLKQAEIVNNLTQQIARAANQVISLYDLIDAIKETLSEIIDTTNFFMALYDADTDTLSLPYFVDEKDHFDRFPAGKTLTAWMIHHRKPLLLQAPEILQMHASGEIELIGTIPQCWLGIPLIIGDLPVAAIVIQNYQDPSAFNEDDLQFLTLLSEPIGLWLLITKNALQAQVCAERFQSIFRFSPIGIALYDTHGELIEANRMFLRTLGIGDYRSAHNWRLFDSFALSSDDQQRLAAREMVTYEWKINFDELNQISKLRSGRTGQATLTVTITPIHTEHSVYNYLLQIVDITERKHLEEERIKSEKMDSLAILTRGIAHDFNNILTAVIGNISLAKMFATNDQRITERLTEAEKASLRARDLVQRLMAFTQGGVLEKQVTDIGHLIQEVVAFAISGSKTKCKTTIAAGLWSCEVDRSQLFQAFNHLIINADQAMPQGGTLTISAYNLPVQPGQIAGLPAGNYVKIIFQDEGIGIPAEFLSKIFDPYFSTKRLGSGLGLTTALAIIKNHRGHITVQSTPNVGTTFTVYLPASVAPHQALPLPSDKLPRGNAKVLLMDDDLAVAAVSKRMLEVLNFTVDIASTSNEAIHKFQVNKKAKQPYQLVILDMTIPGGMGGKEVLKQLRKIDPNVTAIVTTGYNADPIFDNYAQWGFKGALQKPFQLTELAAFLNQLGF